MAARKKPNRLTKAQQVVFTEHMRAGMRRGAAAEAMGFARVDVLNQITEDEHFEAAVCEAEGHAVEHVEEAVYQAAVSGSMTAAKLWFELRAPNRVPQAALPPGGGQPALDPAAELNQLMRGDG
jgi:hypothetical protein